jgi:hypothetical protein
MTIFCVNESAYSAHITKRKSYTVEAVKEGQYSIKNNHNKLVWLPDSCFVDVDLLCRSVLISK